MSKQLDVAQEELAELIQAISKFRRYGNQDTVNEEMADVYVMLAQLEEYLNNSSEVDNWIDMKLNRTCRRIDLGILGKSND